MRREPFVEGFDELQKLGETHTEPRGPSSEAERPLMDSDLLRKRLLQKRGSRDKDI